MRPAGVHPVVPPHHANGMPSNGDLQIQRSQKPVGDIAYSPGNLERDIGKRDRKFISRFNYLESKTISIGKDLKAMSLAEMDVIWDEAKKEEREPLTPKGESPKIT